MFQISVSRETLHISIFSHAAAFTLLLFLTLCLCLCVSYFAFLWLPPTLFLHRQSARMELLHAYSVVCMRCAVHAKYMFGCEYCMKTHTKVFFLLNVD